MIDTLLTILISFLLSCVVCFRLIYSGDYEPQELKPLKKVFSSPLFIGAISILIAISGVILFSNYVPSVLVFTATLAAAYFASYFSHYFQAELHRENLIKEEVRARAISLSEELFRLNSLYTNIAQYLIAMEDSIVMSSNGVNSSDANAFLGLLRNQPNVGYFTLPKFIGVQRDKEKVARFDTNGIHAMQKISQSHAVFDAYVLAQNDYVKMIASIEKKIAQIGETTFVSLNNQDLEVEFGKPAIEKLKIRATDLVALSYSAELQVRETLNYIRTNYEVLVRGSFDSQEVLEYLGEIIMKSGGVSEELDSWDAAKRKIVENGYLSYI